MIRYFLIFLLSFNLLSSNENVVKTSELELILFKMAYESLLIDVKKSKEDSSVNENDLKNINKKIEVIMNELFKDRRVLIKELNEETADIDLKKIREFQEEIALLKDELFEIKKKKREYKESLEKQVVVIEEKKEKSLEKKEKPKVEIKADLILKRNFKKLYNTKKFNALKCFDYEKGSVDLSDVCKEKIKTFIDENKKAIRFELIPIISGNDNTLYTQLRPFLDNIGPDSRQKVSNYLKESLSRHRVINALNYVNELDDDLIVNTANYHVKSKSLKGIVFRAYYAKTK